MHATLASNNTHKIEALSWGYNGDREAFLADAQTALATTGTSLGDHHTKTWNHGTKCILITATPTFKLAADEDTWGCICTYENTFDHDFCSACGRHYEESTT